jgi:hypothetical protein
MMRPSSFDEVKDGLLLMRGEPPQRPGGEVAQGFTDNETSVPCPGTGEILEQPVGLVVQHNLNLPAHGTAPCHDLS